MPNFTPNINLQKDLTTEVYDVGVVNANADKIDTAVGRLNNNVELVKDPTGFTNNAAIGVAYNSTNRTITLTGTFKAYFKGVEVSVLTNGWVSDPHPITLDKIYFLYYDGTQFLFNDTVWGFDILHIAVVQYGTSHKLALKETHGFMGYLAHQEFHNTIGTYKTAGGTLTPASYVIGSTVAADKRPLVVASTVYDEDILHTINALTTETYTQKYLTGAASTVLVTGALDMLPVVGNTPYYNQNNGGTWQQTPMANNDYAAIFLIAAPVTSDAGSQAYRYMWVQPQTISTSLSTIQALTPNDVNIGDSTLFLPEFVFVTKVIIRMMANDWSITEAINLTGNRYNQTGSPSAAYLTIVSTDATLTGDGTPTTPLGVALPLTTQNVGTLINGATEKTTPIDADMVGLMDSVATNVLKKLSWANIKATLKTYFDTLYNLYVHPTTDGNLHVPATGTTNNAKVLTAGATAGSLSWATPPVGVTVEDVLTSTSAVNALSAGRGKSLKDTADTLATLVSTKASFKNGSATFTAGGTTYQIIDAFITANTLVIISPTSAKLGSWSVVSAAGSFTITSTVSETIGVTFDWGATK